jgi:hypothetical protein
MELAPDTVPVPAEVMIAHGAEQMQQHAPGPGINEVSLHGGKSS